MTPEQEKGIMQAFDAYCKIVLKNKARNLHKELAKKNHFEALYSDFPPEIEQSLQYSDRYDFSKIVPSGFPGMEMHVIDPSLAEAISHVLPRFREVLFLSYYLDLSDKEISKLLKLPASTVTSRRNSTLKKLREMLGEKHV